MSTFTENLKLLLWDKLTDPFSHGQLENNWIIIDQHNHEGNVTGIGPEEELEAGTTWSPAGKGPGISTRAILPGAIARYLIKEHAVGHKQIALEGVERENIKNKAVNAEKIADHTVTDQQVKVEALTFASLDPNVVPLGSIMLWWRPSGSAKTPGGSWIVCEGQAWNTVAGNRMGTEGGSGEELLKGNVPNLVGKFPRGSNIAGLSAKGGQSTLNFEHTHTVGEHHHIVNNHVHKFPAHQHTISVDTHKHTFRLKDLVTRGNAFLGGRAFSGLEDHGVVIGKGSPVENNEQSVYLPEHENETIPMNEYSHNHSGNTGAFPETETTLPTVTPLETQNAGSGATSAALANNTNIEPPWEGFVYIMRVR